MQAIRGIVAANPGPERVHYAGIPVLTTYTAEFLRRDIDVVLDDGFFLRSDRLRYAKMAAEVGAQSIIHTLWAPLNVLRSRINERNARLPKYNFWIDPELLESFVAQYETPRDDEASKVIEVPLGV